MARSRRRGKRRTGGRKKNGSTRTAKAARRRVGDAAELARFRDGVRVRAVRMPNKKREAARRACRTTRDDD
ncbi:MAG: hypothetical protein ACKPBF_10785 [Actinomycetota bacterium]